VRSIRLSTTTIGRAFAALRRTRWHNGFASSRKVRSLRIRDGDAVREIGQEDSDRVVLALCEEPTLSFDRLRGLLMLGPEAKFNLETRRRKYLKGDATAAKLGQKSRFGDAWRGFSVEMQAEIVRMLEEAKTGLPVAAGKKVASVKLARGHCRLGLRAIRNMLPFLEGGMDYAQALHEAGYDRPLPNGEIPPPRDSQAKRWAGFPAVQAGIAQLRGLVNALIREFGRPDCFAIAMTRDFKPPAQELSEGKRERMENEKKVKGRADQLRQLGLPVNERNLLRMRLWEELNPDDEFDRRCPYTGEAISLEALLSDDINIDHIIPVSSCLEKGVANKTVCMRRANDDKGAQTPYEAFHDRAGYDWEGILHLAARLPESKRRRFAPDARERFACTGGGPGRKLKEISFLDSAARRYLGDVTEPDSILAVPRRLARMIGEKWGLKDLLSPQNDAVGSSGAGMNAPAKSRYELRHHVIEALLCALMDRDQLARMSKSCEEERQNMELPLPWPALRGDLEEILKQTPNPDVGSPMRHA